MSVATFPRQPGSPRVYFESFGACDCCDAHRILHRIEAYGIETYACRVCRLDDPSEDIDDLEALLERRVNAKPETAEQHAEIAVIEAALVEARASFNEIHGQFGVGA